jgi:hypothetical protein
MKLLFIRPVSLRRKKIGYSFADWVFNSAYGAFQDTVEDLAVFLRTDGEIEIPLADRAAEDIE